MNFDFGDPGAYRFAVRMIYDKSSRTYALDFNKKYEVEVSADGGWSFGGPAVTIEASDGTRSCLVSIGLDKFTETYFEALERFCRLDIDYVGNGETAEERLQDRNDFLRKAVDNYPKLLSDIARSLNKLSREVDEAFVRISSVRRR